MLILLRRSCLVVPCVTRVGESRATQRATNGRLPENASAAAGKERVDPLRLVEDGHHVVVRRGKYPVVLPQARSMVVDNVTDFR
jgi:hypothetical protein